MVLAGGRASDPRALLSIAASWGLLVLMCKQPQSDLPQENFYLCRAGKNKRIFASSLLASCSPGVSDAKCKTSNTCSAEKQDLTLWRLCSALNNADSSGSW